MRWTDDTQQFVDNSNVLRNESVQGPCKMIALHACRSYRYGGAKILRKERLMIPETNCVLCILGNSYRNLPAVASRSPPVSSISDRRSCNSCVLLTLLDSLVNRLDGLLGAESASSDQLVGLGCNDTNTASVKAPNLLTAAINRAIGSFLPM